jgi:hypothetical protein
LYLSSYYTDIFCLLNIFVEKIQEKGLSQNLAAIEESVQNNIASKKKRSSKKEKVDIVGKKEEKFSNSEGKTDENFPVSQSSSKMKENIEKKRNKEGAENETEEKEGNKEENLDVFMVSKKKKRDFQKFCSSEEKSVKFSSKTKVTLFFLSLF